MLIVCNATAACIKRTIWTWRTHAAIMKGGKSGAVVVPGKFDESRLWKKIARDEMPKTDN
jgi:hypothetical protein